MWMEGHKKPEQTAIGGNALPHSPSTQGAAIAHHEGVMRDKKGQGNSTVPRSPLIFLRTSLRSLRSPLRRSAGRKLEGRLNRLAPLLASKWQYASHDPAFVDAVVGSAQFREETAMLASPRIASACASISSGTRIRPQSRSLGTTPWPRIPRFPNSCSARRISPSKFPSFDSVTTIVAMVL
jgi:hypothetical protein